MTKQIGLSMAVGVLSLALSQPAAADELIGIRQIFYLANASGCINNPNPFSCNQMSGPIRIDASPGDYKVIIRRQLDPGAIVGGFRVWSGDQTGGAQFNPGENRLVYHAFGHIYLYFHDWYPYDNPPNAGVEVAVYRVTPELLPYDDFSAALIDGSKWFADQPLNGAGASLELIRRNVAGLLHLRHRVLGGVSGNAGTHMSANRLVFTTPFSEVRFKVAAWAGAASCNVPGAPPAEIGARSWSQLFNDGTSDVGAVIGVTRSTTRSGLIVDGFLASGTRTFGSVDLGPVTMGSTVTLHMKWDQLNRRVDFQKDNEPVQSVTYDVSDQARPRVPFSAMEVVGFVGNCSSGPQSGDMTALFDDIAINP